VSKSQPPLSPIQTSTVAHITADNASSMGVDENSICLVTIQQDGTEQCEIIDAKVYEERERIEKERHLHIKSAAEKPKAPIPFDPICAAINTPLPKTTITMELAHQFNRFGIGLDSTVSSISICSNGTKEIEIINFDGKRYQIIEKTQPGIEPQFTVIPHDINVQTSVLKDRTSSSSSIKNHMQSCS